MAEKPFTLPVESIEGKILFLRGQKVMLDVHLAELYGAETKTLNRAVKRNLERFPSDFMFPLNNQEVSVLRCQIGTSNVGRGGRRYIPYAFTEYGVAMLSTHKELARKLEELEKKYDHQFKVVFDAIRQLMMPPVSKTRKIGFLND